MLCSTPRPTLSPYTTLFRSITGIGSGLGTVLGGVGGPAVTVYAVLSRWPVLPMVATMQPLWIIISSVSFASKWRSEEHTSELQSRGHLVCRLLLEKKKK